jgi:transposase
MEKRKHLSPQQKVIILREHLENQVPLSQLSERYHVHVNLLYKWKKQLFESASDIFSQTQTRESQSQLGKITRLENRIRDKDQLISELVEENINLKKSLHGEI